MTASSRAGAAQEGAAQEGAAQEVAPQAGSALLLVIGATAALAVPAAVLVVVAALAYETEGYRAERAQAEALVETTLAQAGQALEDGSLPLPEPRRPIRIRNGVIESGGPAGSSGRDVGVGRFSTPPMAASEWPALTDRPPTGDAPTFGIGSEVEVRSVVGPRGDARGLGLEADGSRLVDVEARAWFRRAVAIGRARFLWREGEWLRLD